MWKLQHATAGARSTSCTCRSASRCALVMTSQDVIHSFFVPAFRLKQDVVPGRYTTLSFTATRLGEFHLFCAEYCGSEHSAMIGRVVVMAPADFARWLAAGTDEPGLAQRGFALYRSPAAAAATSAGSTVHAPSLDGPARPHRPPAGRPHRRRRRELRARLDPAAAKDVVAGFEPVMPTFAGQVDEEEIEALVAYIRSTGEHPRSRSADDELPRRRLHAALVAHDARPQAHRASSTRSRSRPSSSSAAPRRR